MPIETVLVAVGAEDEDRARLLATAAADVAGPADARVVIGHVFTDEEYAEAITRFGFDRSRDHLTPGDVAERLANVRSMEEYLDERGVEYEVRGATDDSGAAVVRMAEELDADRLFVGGRRRSPTGKAVFGSQAQEIMLNSPCPVTYVREDMVL